MIELFDLQPPTARPPLVVVDREKRLPPGPDRALSVLEAEPHVAGVMQHAPRVGDVPGTEAGEVLGVKRVAALNRPIAAFGAEAVTQLFA